MRELHAMPATNLARFDIVSMRLVVLCAELGSLSAAARRVNCSLSAGSYRLTVLEHMLGVALFTRDHRGLHATQAGDIFVGHARAILEHVAQIDHCIRHARGTGHAAAGSPACAGDS